MARKNGREKGNRQVGYAVIGLGHIAQAADQFAPELIALSKAILEDTEVEPDGEEGLRDVRVIVAALKSAREDRPLTLSWPARRRRPTGSTGRRCASPTSSGWRHRRWSDACGGELTGRSDQAGRCRSMKRVPARDDCNERLG